MYEDLLEFNYSIEGSDQGVSEYPAENSDVFDAGEPEPD